jgi:hypothetical protein
MKYKIQQNNPFFGYIDMKYSIDGGKTYICDFFDTYEDAKSGLAQSLIEINDLEGIEDYRIVKENVKADFDINEKNVEYGQKILDMLKEKLK